jgi:hypothetical protein
VPAWATTLAAVVTGPKPGLYLLEGDPTIHDRLRGALKPMCLWERPANCPEHLRFYCLMYGELQRTAQMVSCHQEIAADGAFSLGMFADFTRTIRANGAWWYRRLFWEAEAAGVRSTGIGCYFDDAFHELLGLTGDEFQDLYHFTVGGPIEDHRLITLPAYAHLRRPWRAKKSSRRAPRLDGCCPRACATSPRWPRTARPRKTSLTPSTSHSRSSRRKQTGPTCHPPRASTHRRRMQGTMTCGIVIINEARARPAEEKQPMVLVRGFLRNQFLQVCPAVCLSILSFRVTPKAPSHGMQIMRKGWKSRAQLAHEHFLFRREPYKKQ